ncbi:MAG: glycerol-3-phosphate acyltransferase [Gammaproteobacteria bacterium]|nr:glycerol-3-phosphate acyltransferase [Gammaproteobacteria bacterium]
MADSINNSESFNSALTSLAEATGRPTESLKQESKAYLQELISVPKRLALDLRVWLDNYMISQGYEKEVVYSQEAIEKLRDVVKEYPTMVLWTHKIYFDGSVVTSILHKHRFPLLHMFGGINMAFLGLGYILRHSGAIFIRRSFQDNPLYKLVLRQYIAYLMEKRFPLSWAFEGTRSRIGKLMPPRYGLLKYVLESAHDAEIGDIHIIPVSVSYDYMRDVEDFAAEQTGKEKKPESLKWFLSYVSSLRRPMGRIYMDVADPVVINTAPEPGDSLALAKIAFEVAVRVNEVTPITLTSLVCFCLLGAAPRALTKQELQTQVNQLADWALARNIRISSDFDPNNAAHTQATASILVKNGLLTYYDQGADMVIGIAHDQHPVASYYRNMIVHHYLNKAILELALLKLSDQELASDTALTLLWQETDILRELFKFEFFYPVKEKFRELLQQELSRVNSDWQELIAQPGGAMSLLQQMMPIVAHAVFLPFVEAYTVLTECVAGMPAAEIPMESACVTQSLKQAKQAYLQRRISSEASIAKLLFSNAFKLMENQGLTVAGGEELITRRIELSKTFRDQARSLDRLRLMALPKY